MGDVVNVAARLMARAPVGEIYATPGLLDRSRTRFATVELEPLAVKGKARPLPAVSVGRALGSRRSSADGAPRMPLLGREDELAVLGEALLAARRGEGRLVEIAGDPGIGKRRLLEEVAPAGAGRADPARDVRGLHGLRARTASGASCSCRCSIWAGTTTRETVMGRLRAEVEARAPALVPWLPLLAIPLGLRVPATPVVARLSEEFRAAALHDAVVKLLSAVLPGPAILQFEQAHHMDAASADLLRAVVEALPGRPWLVLTTRRDVPAGFAAPDVPQAISLRPPALDPRADARAGGGADRGRAGAAARPRPGGGALGRQPAVPPRPARQRRRRRATRCPDSIEAAATARIDRLSAADRALAAPGLRARHELPPAHGGRRPGGLGAGRRAHLGAPFATSSSTTAAAGCASARASCATPPTPGCPSARGDGCTPSRASGWSASWARRRASGRPSSRCTSSSRASHDRAWTYARAAGDRARDSYAYADAARLYRRALDAAGPAGIAAGELAAAWIDLGEARVRTGEPDAAAGGLPARPPAPARRPGRRRRRCCTARRSWPTARATRCAPCAAPSGRSARSTASRACARAPVAPRCWPRWPPRGCARAAARTPSRCAAPAIAEGEAAAAERPGRARLLHPRLGAARRGPRRRRPCTRPRAGDLRAPGRSRPPGCRAQQPRRLRLPRGPLAGRRRPLPPRGQRERAGAATSSTPPSATATSARCCSARAAWRSRSSRCARPARSGAAPATTPGWPPPPRCSAARRCTPGAKRRAAGCCRRRWASTAGCGTTPKPRSPRRSSPRRWTFGGHAERALQAIEAVRARLARPAARAAAATACAAARSPSSASTRPARAALERAIARARRAGRPLRRRRRRSTPSTPSARATACRAAGRRRAPACSTSSASSRCRGALGRPSRAAGRRTPRDARAA